MTDKPKTLLEGFGEATEQVIALRRERDMLRAEREVWANIAQERNDLRAENERLLGMYGLGIPVEVQRLREVQAEVERLRARLCYINPDGSHVLWLDQVERERDNLRSALDHNLKLIERLQASELYAEVDRLNQALDMLAEEREAWKAKAEQLRAALEQVVEVFEPLARMGAGRPAIDEARAAL